jgi:hypothetical protein
MAAGIIPVQARLEPISTYSPMAFCNGSSHDRNKLATFCHEPQPCVRRQASPRHGCGASHEQLSQPIPARPLGRQPLQPLPAPPRERSEKTHRSCLGQAWARLAWARLAWARLAWARPAPGFGQHQAGATGVGATAARPMAASAPPNPSAPHGSGLQDRPNDLPLEVPVEIPAKHQRPPNQRRSPPRGLQAGSAAGLHHATKPERAGSPLWPRGISLDRGSRANSQFGLHSCLPLLR